MDRYKLLSNLLLALCCFSIKKKKIIALLSLVVLCSSGRSFAQNHQLAGTVHDSLSNGSLPNVTISIEELKIWTVTDEQGKYKMDNVPPGNYTISYRAMGYREKVISTEIIKNSILDVRLQFQSIALSVVAVTSKEKQFGSKSTISREAVEHLQPKSLKDVFQLLPGAITENPTLASPGQIKLREIEASNNSALGALIMIDNNPLSNDANMQVFNSAQAGNATSTPGVAGRGTDLRDISAENIESVEVIRGIPSVEYGNLTSGVVLVKSKVGQSPLTARFKVDPNTKIGSIYKGMKLKNQSGYLNAGIDFTRAYDDIREKFKGYDRLTGSLIYSNTLFSNSPNPMDFKANFSYFNTLDSERSDAQQLEGEEMRSKKQGIRAGISGKWMLRKNWITNLEYNISGDYTQNSDYLRELYVLSSGSIPNPTTYIPGVYEVDYLPGRFHSAYDIDGKPYNAYAKIKGDWSKKWYNINNTVLVGLDWMLSGNNGAGLLYDQAFPPFRHLSTTLRPRAARDLPVLNNLSFFLEDRLSLPLGTTNLIMQGGLRVNKMLPTGLTSLDPRINIDYEILNSNNNSILDKFSITGGIGLSHKMPTLSYISPDNAYFDQPTFNYLDRENSLAVITTHMISTVNDQLKPARNTKKEIGFMVAKKTYSLAVTAYHEKLTDGLGFQSQPYISHYESFTVSGAGRMPIFENGRVYYQEGGQRLEAASQWNKVIRTYASPVNRETSIKKGVEYVFNTGKIEPLQTSFVVDGAWLYQEAYGTLPTYQSITTTYQGRIYPYIAIMPSGSKTIRQRFNTNIRMITHIPRIKMIASLVTQIIWDQRIKYAWEDENGKSLIYYLDDNGQRIYGDAALEDINGPRYVDPVAYMDDSGIVHQWQPENAHNSPYQQMLSVYGTTYYFIEEKLKPTVQFNLRLTKQFSNYFEIAFMANNFFKMNPTQISNRTGLYVERNTAFYFGAEVNIKF